MASTGKDEADENWQQRYTALAHEFDPLKHRFDTPQAGLKLAIFDQLPLPVWACDRDCRIVFWNAAASRLYGFSAEEDIVSDFVHMFVNEPERDKACDDCADIIDNNKPIKNMAEDRDKHGNTRKLVTQCFAIYNVDGHAGLQVEISYEVQDIDRLKQDLERIQEDYRRAEKEKIALQRQLLEETQKRGFRAISNVVETVRNSITSRKAEITKTALLKGADKEMIEEARAKLKAEIQRLNAWEQDMTTRVGEQTTIDGLKRLIEEIQRDETFDV